MTVYSADRSLKGKLRRRITRLQATRAAAADPPGPMVSICFDDAPVSAALEGARILQARGVKGTYFISMGLAGQDGPMGPNADAGQVRALMQAGHEIGCHTFSHLDCGQAPAGLAAGDVEQNLQALEALGAPEPQTFAYPYGDVSAPAKAALAEPAWLILYTHDVRENPSPFGCTPGALERLVDEALAGGAEVVTVAEGCRRMGALFPPS